MFAPPLYSVRKFPLSYLIDHNLADTGTDSVSPLRLRLEPEEESRFYVQQQDNLLFRQIRLITEETSRHNRHIIFVDCDGQGHRLDTLRRLILYGLNLNGTHFTNGERSASMVRTSILSFVSEDIADKLQEAVTLGAAPSKSVLSKWYAYRGLMLSSCHCLEQWYPKIIIVPDYYRTIPGQHIRYAQDCESTFTDKDGRERTWVQKEIAETVRDIRINVFDGCGIHHPEITRQVKELLSCDTDPTSILWRAPFIKGMTHEADYVAFLTERGVTHIRDIWGTAHDIRKEPMLILCESMYKGKPYFHRDGTAADWDNYLTLFRQYRHSIGVAKWNFSSEEEPVYTRANYQILQDLELSYEDFASLAAESIEWLERIIQGDELYACCFLGLFADRRKALNQYTQAILKDPRMLKEAGVRNYFISLVDKYKNELKCGKLWIKATFKFLVPDLIMLMEHIGNLPVNGCLEADECYVSAHGTPCRGDYLIERNPHICRSEHTVLRAEDSEVISRYCKNLANVCMINGKSITPQRLNGADFDGDLVLVVDNETMLKGVDRNAPIVMDIEDKITVLEEEDTPENRLQVILRGMNSLIGETSNCATGYHNKSPRSPEQKQKYDSYVDLLSIINGKAIDSAKTGVVFPIPRHIAKYGKPLPYFMKYAGPYYAGISKFSRSKSNLNRLCMEIEKWEKPLRWKRTYEDFDYHIMMDLSIPPDPLLFCRIEALYLEYQREMSQLAKDSKSIREEKKGWEINWGYYYDYYRNKCMALCPDEKKLANIAVVLCYEKYPKQSKSFLWRIAGRGILENIKQVPAMRLPLEDPEGDRCYLGRRYRMELIQTETAPEEREEIES
ncbi:RNA dependent RNA polymerase [Anaerolentibacter hominis]|uniref:RNA dependent RNA polymerase n=1 Tax=Anaerolentibacter hominis TaxID=3079009 RepID=UPI0031B81063